eukprot:12677692-Alexandrium_andersonii.AAC.2
MPCESARPDDPCGPGVGGAIASSSSGPRRRLEMAVPSHSSNWSSAPGSRMRAVQRMQRNIMPGITALHTGQN